MKVLQYLFSKIKYIDDLIKIDIRKRKIIICLLTFFINTYFILIMSNLVQTRSVIKLFIICILLFLFFLFIGVDNQLDFTILKSKLFYFWYIYSFISILSSIINKSTNIIVTIPLILVPIIWLISKDRILNFIKEISIGSSLSLFLLLFLNIFNVPIDSGQYFSFLQSPIGLCIFLTTLMPFLLYLIAVEKNNLKKNLLLLFFLINISYVIYSGSRTGFLTLLIILFIWFVYSFNTTTKKIFLIPKIFIFILTGIFIVNTFSSFQNTIYYSINSFLVNKETEEYSNNNFNETKDTEEVIINNSNQEETESSEKENLEKFTNRIEITDKNLNTFSAGRIDIWKEYLTNLNIFGHKDISNIKVTVDYKNKEFTSISAHNTFIQVLYDYGVLSGLFFAIIIILSIYKGIKSLKENNKNIESYLVFSIISNFIMIGMFNSTFYFYNYINMFYFLIFINPFLLERKNNY